MAKAIGTYKLGLASGTASFMATGTAIYDALQASTENNNLFPISSIKTPERTATATPLNIGTAIAKAAANHPFLMKSDNFLPLVIPISNKKNC